jgi:amino acid permease
MLLHKTITYIIKISSAVVVAIFLSFGFFAINVVPVAAQTSTIPVGCPGGLPGPVAPGVTCPTTTSVSEANKLSSSSDCALNNTCGNCNNDSTVKDCGLVGKYLNPLIDFLAATVGVVVTIGIVIGGIEYSASGGDPQRATAARKRISNAIIALVAFLFLYAFLQWLVPGGLLNGL